jgi:hypothetical protein
VVLSNQRKAKRQVLRSTLSFPLIKCHKRARMLYKHTTCSRSSYELMPSVASGVSYKAWHRQVLSVMLLASPCRLQHTPGQQQGCDNCCSSSSFRGPPPPPPPLHTKGLHAKPETQGGCKALASTTLNPAALTPRQLMAKGTTVLHVPCRHCLHASRHWYLSSGQAACNH